MLPALLLVALAAPAEPVEYAAARLLSRASGGEPDVREVQRAAARVATTPGADGWRSRARLAALLPRVSAELRADERRYRVVGLTGTSEVDYVRDSPGTTVALRLTWELRELVFGDVELRVAREARAADRARIEAVQRATRLYYARQQLRVAIASEPPTSPRVRAEQELELEELGAELDLLTGGLFSGGGP